MGDQSLAASSKPNGSEQAVHSERAARGEAHSERRRRGARKEANAEGASGASAEGGWGRAKQCVADRLRRRQARRQAPRQARRQDCRPQDARTASPASCLLPSPSSSSPSAGPRASSRATPQPQVGVSWLDSLDTGPCPGPAPKADIDICLPAGAAGMSADGVQGVNFADEWAHRQAGSGRCQMILTSGYGYRQFIPLEAATAPPKYDPMSGYPSPLVAPPQPTPPARLLNATENPAAARPTSATAAPGDKLILLFQVVGRLLVRLHALWAGRAGFTNAVCRRSWPRATLTYSSVPRGDQTGTHTRRVSEWYFFNFQIGASFKRAGCHSRVAAELSAGNVQSTSSARHSRPGQPGSSAAAPSPAITWHKTRRPRPAIRQKQK